MDEDAVEYVEITTTATRGRIVIDLVGERYDIRKPKMHGLIDAVRRLRPSGDVDKANISQQVAVFDEMEGWLFSCFHADDAQRIRERLADPDDNLDVPQIMEAFQAVVEKVSERPTSSPSGSRGSRQDGGRRSTAGPSRTDSIPEPSPRNGSATSSGGGSPRDERSSSEQI